MRDVQFSIYDLRFLFFKANTCAAIELRCVALFNLQFSIELINISHSCICGLKLARKYFQKLYDQFFNRSFAVFTELLCNAVCNNHVQR